MKKNNWAAIVLLIILPLNIRSQVSEEIASQYNWFDAITGLENSDLHYGIVYEEKHRIKNKKSKFIFSPDFLSGSVIYDNLPYFDLNLKYNAYEDEVLMKVGNKFGGKSLQLYKDRISSFTIAGHRFIKIEPSDSEAAIMPGYYEISKENLFFTLLIKHQKELKERLGVKSVYHEFEDTPKEYVLHCQNNYYAIDGVSDLTTIFPDHKEKLDSFEKSQNSKLHFDIALEAMLNYLETLLLKDSNRTAKK